MFRQLHLYYSVRSSCIGYSSDHQQLSQSGLCVNVYRQTNVDELYSRLHTRDLKRTTVDIAHHDNGQRQFLTS